MTSTNSLSSRLEELRSGNPQSPPGEKSYSGHNTPMRYSGSFMPSHSQPSSQDIRASLQRRFTTDSGKFPSMTPIGQQPQPSNAMEPGDTSSTALHKVQLLEKKRQEYEFIRNQRKKFDAEMEKQEATRRNELDQIAHDLQSMNFSSGHQSEPTTPPEFGDTSGTLANSRRNRHASTGIVYPPGFSNRNSRSGMQLNSALMEAVQSPTDPDKLPSKSVPGSRRGSNDRDRALSYVIENSVAGPRSSATSQRYSMPVTGLGSRKRESIPEYSSVMDVGHINTTGFLFGDDEEKSGSKKEATTSPDHKSYLQMSATDDKFPILVRHDDHPGLLSASSAALDLALSQSPAPEVQTNGWTPFALHRPSQQSIGQSSLDTSQSTVNIDTSSPQSTSQSVDTSDNSPLSVRQIDRRSMEATMLSYAQKNMLGHTVTGGGSNTRPNLANLQSSFSTNDIPTRKTTNSISATVTPPRKNPQESFHNHNASLGRIPPSAVNHRHSREISTNETRREEPSNGFKQSQSDLHAGAAPFGPSASSPTSQPVPGIVSPINGPQYGNPSFYGGYGMQMMNMGINPMQMANPLAFNNQMASYQAQGPFPQFSPYPQQPRYQDSQARVIQQRRMQNVEDNARFTNIKLEQCQGEIYSLCKDQHGCRFLQKQLEAQSPEHVHMIFLETNQHVVELMTDPFGNYLCQKLLEYSNDDQRTVLINNAAPQLVKIALNQHGTRALQKMIEFISTKEQTQTIIHALKDRVVDLIQDLNGNHVIQKCLNRLSPEDAQFIFDAVGVNCVVVGTHRHGCCVLQRCIDHASGRQKADLIGQITNNAFSLVQDPFGNYVLQYIVDLGEACFTSPLCCIFQRSIPSLSKQKFSSNVIEKCLRSAEPEITRMMVEEMLNANELEKMLRDSFANYVVQTALDYADPETKSRLVEAIRPIIPAIRHTPYGRRIQSKIMGTDGAARSSGLNTPNDASSPGQLPLGRSVSNGQPPAGYQTQMPNGLQNNYVADHNQGVYHSNGGMSSAASVPLSGHPTAAAHPQPFNSGFSNFAQFGQSPAPNTVHQTVPPYGRNPQHNGFNYF